MMMLGAWLQTLVAGAADVGIPLPYSPERDDCVALVLLCCFFLSSYVLSHSHKFLLQLGHDFIMHRERASIFATSTGTDMRYLLLLLLQMCVLSGLFLFVCSGSLMPEWIERFPSFWLLGAYVGICVVYLFVKWLLYSFLGWIFSTRIRSLSGWSPIQPFSIIWALVCSCPFWSLFTFICRCKFLLSSGLFYSDWLKY